MIYELKHRWYKSGTVITTYYTSLTAANTKVDSIKASRGTIVSLDEYQLKRRILPAPPDPNPPAPGSGGFSSGFSGGFK